MIPATWPQAPTSGNQIYKVMIVDEGSYTDKDSVRGTGTESVLCVRVENLPDTVTAIQLAETAAELAFPTHPDDGCMQFFRVGPMFGHTRLLGNSMIVGLMMTTDTGHPAKLVNLSVPATPVVTDGTTGSTGTVVLVRLTYRYQQKISSL